MIDSHCHLYFDIFNDNRDQIVQETKDAGVETVINIGVDLESSNDAIKLTEKYDSFYATVGIHPSDSKKTPKNYLDKLKILSGHKKVVAIGEIGLDFYRDYSPRDIQEKVFREQLDLVTELKMPIVIHTRDSFDKTLSIVKEYSGRLYGGIFHCFSGDISDARKVIELGFHISVGGVVTYNKAGMADVARDVPLEWLLLETDAPFLTPVPFRGKTNCPEYVKYVYQKIAELKEMPLTEVEKIVDRNCQKLFKLVEVFGG